MKLSTFRVCTTQLIILCALLLSVNLAHAQKYMAYEFAGNDWLTESGFGQDIGGANWKKTWWNESFTLLPPGVANNQRYARFPLRRYNPDDPGKYFSGTHIRTNTWAWKLNPQSGKPLEFTVQMRFPDMREGVLAAFFIYEDIEAGGGSEIDVEVPMHLLVSDHLWLNVHKGSSDFETFQPGSPIQHVPKSASWWKQWHTYKVSWTKDSLTWYVGGEVVRKVPAPNLPKFLPDPQAKMNVHFNIWAPPPEWALGQRVDGSAPQPPYNTSTNKSVDPLFPDYPEKGRGNYFDVQWVEISGGVRIKGKK